MKSLMAIAVLWMSAGSLAHAAGNDRPLAANDSRPQRLTGELSAGESDKRGELKYSYVSSFGADFSALSVSVSAPLDDDSNTALASLDGLGNTNNIEFEYYRGTTGFDPLAYGGDLESRCVTAGLPGNECDLPRLAQALNITPSELDAQLLEKNNKSSVEYSLSAKSGEKKYEYFDPGFSKRDSRERSYSFTAYLGWRMFNSSIGVSATRERAYEAADEVTVCAPLGMSLSSCETAPASAPGGNTSNIGRVEYKRWSGNYGYAVNVSHNDETSVTGIEVPVYFVMDPDDEWGGGIRFGWRDDTRDFTASFFIGLGW